MLNITAKEVAMLAGVAYSSVKYFECGRCTPIPRTIECIREACEKLGVRFIQDGVMVPAASYDPLLRLYDARRRAVNRRASDTVPEHS